jgi:hypothetical protein
MSCAVSADTTREAVSGPPTPWENCGPDTPNPYIWMTARSSIPPSPPRGEGWGEESCGRDMTGKRGCTSDRSMDVSPPRAVAVFCGRGDDPNARHSGSCPMPAQGLPEAHPEATHQATVDVHWTAAIRATSSAYRQATARATRSAQSRAAARAPDHAPIPAPPRAPPQTASGVYPGIPLQIARRVSSRASRQAISGTTWGTAYRVGF